MFALSLVLLSAGPVFGAPVSVGRSVDMDSPRTELDPRTRLADSLRTSIPGSMAELMAGAVDPETYVLGPGDVLSLERSSPAGTFQTLQVDAEGTLYLPDLGRRRVAGMTLSEARRGILQDLRPYMLHTRAEMRLLRPRVFKVFLLGETPNPGAVVSTATNRSVEAIGARGPLGSAASERNIELHRASGAVERVDMQAFLLLGDQTHNPPLADGDRLVVPRKRTQMGLIGSVMRPENYEIAPGDSLGTILRLAGGVAPGARTDSVLLLRFRDAVHTDSIWLSLPDGAERAVQADDRVFVRTAGQWHPQPMVYVDGEVRVPGAYPIREGNDRLSDLLPRLGGFTPLAALSSAVIMRAPEATVVDDPDLERLRRLARAEMTASEYQDLKMRTQGRHTIFQIDLGSGLTPGAREDILLRNGDRLMVPSLARTVRVGGTVVRPGLFGFLPGLEPDAYVDLAGGFAPRADRGEMRVIRSADGQSLTAREVSRVSPGDFIWVPQKPDGTPFWGVFKDIVGVAAQIVTVVWVITKTTN